MSHERFLPMIPTHAEASDRREFLKVAGSTALFAALGISVSACGSGDAVTDPGPDGGGSTNPATSGLTLSGNTLAVDLDQASFSGLKNQGGWVAIVTTLSGREIKVLAVNVDGSLIRAFSAVCPHQGCDNSWRYGNEVFRCTCHGSEFANDGTRLSGPATRDLSEFSTSRSGSTLSVTLG